MFPLFPVVEPTVAGLKVMWSAVLGEVSSLVTKNVAKSILNIVVYILKLMLVVVISFLECITVDFFNNIVKYWKKDFRHD